MVAGCVVATLLAAAPAAVALDNGVGTTAALGWSSWNYFLYDVNATLIEDIADALVATGLRDAGYNVRIH